MNRSSARVPRRLRPSTRLHGLTAALLLTALLVAGAASVGKAGEDSGRFVDDDGNLHEEAIELIAAAGITSGCNPPANDRFCPDRAITRGEMAAFLARAFGVGPSPRDYFVDDAGNEFEEAINRIGNVGITAGCNPPMNDRYCPADVVQRGQMAAFLARALDLDSDPRGDWFVDDTGSVFETSINLIRDRGLTSGCNPPVNDRYCPDSPVTRAQMATFLARALGLLSVAPPPPTTTTTTTTLAPPPPTTTTTTTTTTLAPPPPPPPNPDEPPFVPGVGASVPEGSIGATFHVDPSGSDSNSGTVSRPVATIGRAIALAQAQRLAGQRVKVVIAPGTYREFLDIRSSGNQSEPTLILEAAQPGTVTVSGSDVWTNWTRVGTSQVYWKTWNYNWGLSPVPPAWPREPSDIVRRRELVFANGSLLTQVLTYGELGAGTYFVDEAANRLYVQAPSGTTIPSATMEVGIRAELLSISGARNIVIRDLRFRHAASQLQGNNTSILSSNNVLIDNTTFEWSNWSGLSVSKSENITVRNSRASNNGGRGIASSQTSSILIENSETSYNNWRGHLGDYYSNSVGGTVQKRTHRGVFRNLISIGNHSSALWFDTDNADIYIEGAVLCDNRSPGLVIEASQGPIWVHNNVICRNEMGIQSSSTANVTVTNNKVCDNHLYGIVFSGGYRWVDNRETGQTYNLSPFSNWVMDTNTVTAHGANGWVIFSPMSRTLFEDRITSGETSLTATNNTYGNPNTTNAFAFGATGFGLAEWQRRSHTDNNATWTNNPPTCP